MSLPIVYARALIDWADLEALSPVWIFTLLKSKPKRDSIKSFVDASSGEPPLDRILLISFEISLFASKLGLAVVGFLLIFIFSSSSVSQVAHFRAMFFTSLDAEELTVSF